MSFGAWETLHSFDTCQFKDYSKMAGDFDLETKAKGQRKIFPRDCRRAFEMGQGFVTQGVKDQGTLETKIHH